MQQVTFTLRTLTPLFLAGADQTQAELRAPTFRGLMRYWYRALIGGIVGANQGTLQQVMEAEKAVFGATDTGSAVSIRIKVSKESLNRTEEFRRTGTGWNVPGKDYLFWSMEQFGNKPRRRYFPKDMQFEVTLSTPSTDSTALERALAAFWLLVNLGGIGSRSRRCAGSLVIQHVKDNTTRIKFDTPKSIEELQTQINQGIKLARELYNAPPILVSSASFDILAQQTASIWILYDKDQPWLTPEAAMNAIGASLQNYRRSILPPRDRKIFGLPLKGVSNKRRASPLLLRIAEIQEEGRKRYVGIAIVFKTIGVDALGDTISVKDYSLIEKWFMKFSGRKQVML